MYIIQLLQLYKHSHQNSSVQFAYICTCTCMYSTVQFAYNNVCTCIGIVTYTMNSTKVQNPRRNLCAGTGAGITQCDCFHYTCAYKFTACVKSTAQYTKWPTTVRYIWLGTGTLPSRTSTFACRLGPSARAASRPIRKLCFRAETDYLLSPSSGRITQGSQHRR